MTIAIIDYGAGNLHSVGKALELASVQIGRPEAVIITSEPDFVAKADHVILPGDGAFADCRTNLDSVPGMIEAINETIDGRGRPFLGICVGMQLLATRGIEYGVTKGLDRIAGEVREIHPTDPHLKVPHMGWNTLNAASGHALLEGIPLGEQGWHAYFLHSYQLYADDPADIVATADYGGPVTAIVTTGNIAGTQFHPEKSQKLGLALLANFLKWKP
ncbi:imidazole glycerol phosphate synthase subunit HisH [Kaistia dalseonensis]|uniref:Imidazole glycerol phosphate synthase subunit HisH n=1 Tax=Kaistia dalseonensis TaxID=410840 RepID=A0ABU0H545_9HYPH|nr:imidazole glycerol phosphate synthase subunit HisH [Kaistia dalseonensis]MCX5494856.1 imidazole glycerol phosphate synthase subunit HisH [Kaistia dalseonensis]MDQ0437437.1 glutamine amidotransferase [Kaistia dalseonensis]